MTAAAEAEVGRWGTRLTPKQPVWVRVGVVVAILAVAFVVSQTCQKSQIRFNKNQAIAKAERQVDFTPQRTQVRLLRQGLDSKPYWIVSLSTPGQQEGHLPRPGRGPHRRQHGQGRRREGAALSTGTTI